MKKLIVMGLAILLFSGIINASWKDIVLKNQGDIMDAKSITSELTVIFKEIPENEKGSASSIIAYCYNLQKNLLSEKIWIEELFEKRNFNDLDLTFLNIRNLAKVTNYVEDWKKQYPLVKFWLPKNKWVYGSFPEEFIMISEASTTIELSIPFLNKKEMLVPNKNKVKFSLKDLSNNPGITKIMITLKSSKIEIEKELVFNTSYTVPDNIIFEPSTGSIKVKGKGVKPETESELKKIVKRRFDKKYFMKYSLPYLGVGLLGYGLGESVFIKSMNDDTGTINNRTLMYSLNRTTKVFSIGLSLKGVINLFRSFKKDVSFKTEKKILPGSKSYNRFVEMIKKRAEKEIFLVINLNVGGEE